MQEEQMYTVIKELVDHGGNKDRASLRLGCSRRSIDRHIAGYKNEGKAYFDHGNSGRRPSHSLDVRIVNDVKDLYLNKYPDANIAHFTELLRREENISISESAVRKILAAADVLSPKAWRKTRRHLKKKLEAKIAKTKNTKLAALLASKIVAIEDAHPRRPRCSKFGEMIQMDASLHLWFGDNKATLHLAIDDATGIIVGAWFELQETLKGYYRVLKQILDKYGIPYMFYTDRRTVFEYRKSGSQDTADDTFTQFGYACHQLGIEIKTTSIPQAKGRIERLNGTLQSRLPVELRLKGVTTIEQANEYLSEFIANYNAQFALSSDSIPSVFEKQPSPDKIDRILAVVTERTVDSGHSIRFENKYWRTVNMGGMPVYFYKGTKGLVIRTFSGALFFSSEDGVFALEQIPEHERISKSFDFKSIATIPKPRCIPALDHPWRRAAFVAFVKKQIYCATA